MRQLQIQAVPNQDLRALLDGQQYEIRLHAIKDCMYADITLNGVLLTQGTRCLENQQIIPYSYLEGVGGNFFFSTLGGNPQYADFGTDTFLWYLSNAEMATLRATLASTAVTAASLLHRIGL